MRINYNEKIPTNLKKLLHASLTPEKKSMGKKVFPH